MMKQTKRRTGYVFKRGEVFWLRYVIGGKRVSHSLKTGNRREANQEAARIMAPISAADEAAALRAVYSRLTAAEETAAALDDAAHPPLTVAAAWPAYAESKIRPQSGPRTFADDEGIWAGFADWLNAERPGATYLRDVTAEDAEAYVRHRQKEGLSGSRINKVVVFLKRFFRVLAKPGRLTANPFADIAKVPHVPEVKREFTIEELKTIIESAKGELKTLMMLGTFTGLRLGDAATLKWEETDVARAIIKRVVRKGARRGKVVIVGIPAILGEHLAALKRTGPYIMPETAELYLVNNGADVSKRIQAHLENCGIQTIKPGTGWEKVKGKDGAVTERYTGTRAVVVAGFHSLRHTFVSLHAAAGTPQAVMMKLVGHGSVAMSQHYTHVSEATAKQTAAALPAILGAVEAKKEPLPAWAAAAVKRMTARNWKATRAALLAG